MVKPYQTYINLAKSIPGVKDLSAIWIIAEVGIDMSVFPSAEYLASWAGLSPTNNESAGKKKSVKISKAGVYIKPLLIQCALGAIRNTKNQYFKRKYDSIKKRRGHKKAIIAIARMILVSIYHMFSTGEIWHPYDLDIINKPKPTKQILNLNNTLEYLSSIQTQIELFDSV